jgi:hypothetical protein
VQKLFWNERNVFKDPSASIDMLKELKELRFEKSTLLILLGIFIFTELIDFLLDSWLGNSPLHSILQLLLFIFLFILISKIFIHYSKNKIKKLIPEELMNILKKIKESENKGIMINQRKMRELLGITKPTLKKRIGALLEFNYIFFEERGNHRYFRLTKLGNSVIC